MDKKLDSGQKIVDKKLNNGQCAKNRTLESSGQWTRNTRQYREWTKNWTVSGRQQYGPTVGCPLSTVQCPLSAVHCPIFFCPKTFSSSFSEDSGQWTKTVNSSPGQGGYSSTLFPSKIFFFSLRIYFCLSKKIYRLVSSI